MGRLIALLFCLGSVGCHPRQIFERFGQSPEVGVAVAAIRLLQQGDVSAFLARLPANARTPQAEIMARRMITEVVPKELELDRRVVDYQWNWTNGHRSVTVDIEYRFRDTYVIAEAVVNGSAPNLQLLSLRVWRTAEALESQNVFRLAGKPLRCYFVLVAALIVPAFIVGTSVICFRTPLRRRKVLWILYILLGFGKLSVNWTTGAVWIEKLAIQVLGTGLWTQGLYGPWVVSASLPVGGILFLARRRRLMLIPDVKPMETVEETRPNTARLM